MKRMTLTPRRDFLRTAAAAGASALLAGCSGSDTAAEAPAEGLQPFTANLGAGLYTLREVLPNDPQKVLTELAAIGYREVEPLLFYPAASAPFDTFRQAGLQPVSAHILAAYFTGNWGPVEQMAAQMGSDASGLNKPPSWKATVEKAKADGIEYLVVSALLPPERTTADDVRAMADQFNQAGEVSHQAGIQLCYHNHADDFAPLEGTTVFEILRERFDKQLAKFELDVCWAAVSGNDPVALLEQNAGRIPMIHLKDLVKGFQQTFEAQKIRPEDMAFPGEGSLHFPAILKAAAGAGVEHYFVEHDYPKDAVAGYRRSYEYLRSIKV